jgi:nucleoside-diphosphate-sugar epimerase
MEKTRSKVKPLLLVVGTSSPAFRPVVRDLVDKYEVYSLPNLYDDFQTMAALARQPDFIIDFGPQRYPEDAKFIDIVSKVVPNLKLFIMDSSLQTYGHQRLEDGAFTEDTIQYPISPARIEQVAVENYLAYAEYEYNLPYTIIRRADLYSEYPEYVVKYMLDMREVMLGDSEMVNSYIAGEDLAKLYATVLSKFKLAVGDVYVTGPNSPLSTRQLARLISDKLEWNGTIDWQDRPDLELYYANSDPTHTRKALGWSPKIGINEALDSLIERLKTTPSMV